MNILLWITQVVLALFALAGGAYKIFAHEQLSGTPAAAALSRWAWGSIGAFEMLCGVLLVAPLALRWLPILTPLAAAALAIESTALALLYARYSLQLDATNPMVWVVLMAVMAAFVAFGRFAR